MIDPQALRIGNYLMQKIQNRIITTACTLQHFELMGKGGLKDFFPVVLNASVLEKCGFRENQDYPLLPQAREFILVLPVMGSNRNEICAYIKNNKECFGRAMMNTLPISNNFHHLHQLQNLYFALTGEELPFKL